MVGAIFECGGTAGLIMPEIIMRTLCFSQGSHRFSNKTLLFGIRWPNTEWNLIVHGLYVTPVRMHFPELFLPDSLLPSVLL